MRCYALGDAGALRYEDTERPAPGPGQALVRAAANPSGPADLTRAGGAREMSLFELPHISGADLGGADAS
ncbi:hypothetical protein ACIP79_02865 [Streptomyces sp. NPDC088747]|uniref:hypothetical protein n=1 Tax=Streptomyces sp. NPDC088747 TaxID=3365886 RepID=UPI00382AF633